MRIAITKGRTSKSSVLLLLAGISLMLAGNFSYAENFENGFEAYERGDFSTAMRIFRLFAEQGDQEAQHNLGSMYLWGQGIAQDYKEAIRWKRMSAAQGNQFSQFDLGTMYRRGQGVPQDYKEAVKWYRKSAEQGNPSAQSNLGFMYLTGTAVAQDNVYAHMWWSIAASSGETTAATNRDKVVEEMTKDQIAEAQRLARECVKKDYKDC